jgi:DNA repair exonuclease SbcCD ATPase subunit
MIIFKAIRWKNFLSTGNAFTEIRLDEYDNALIIGDNGAGKSTILDALTFSLFGKSFRKITKGGLVNSVNGKDCVVEIEFSTNGRKYRVVRGIKPAVFEIWCDGICLNQDSASKDYQEHLEKFILKMNLKSFTQIVILGSASFTPFMQLSAADRRAVIEDLLDIQVFSVMNQIMKQRNQENKQSIENTRVQIIAKQEKKTFIEKTLKSLAESDKAKLDEYQDTLNKLKTKKTKTETDIEKLTANIKTLAPQSAQIPKLRKQQMTLIQLQSKIQTNLDDHRNKSAFYSEHDDCPVCKQQLDGSFKQDQVSHHKAEIEKIAGGLDELTKKLQDCQNKILEAEAIQQKYRNDELELSKCKTELVSVDDAITQIEKKINTQTDTISQESQKELELVISQLAALSKEQEELLSDRQYIQTSLELLKDDGIKTKIIKQYLPIINQQINKYLSQMGFLVKFEINESFEETIKSRFRDEFSYQNFSEGEKMRIDLAILLTWRHIARMRNSCSTNLLIMDEIFDGSLDGTGIDEFIKIMWNMVGDTNVFIISHKQDQMIDKFKKIYRFRKIKNFSRLT